MPRPTVNGLLVLKKNSFNINVLQQTACLVGPDALAVVRPTEVYLLDFFYCGTQFYILLGPYLCLISFLYLDLYVLEDNS